MDFELDFDLPPPTPMPEEDPGSPESLRFSPVSPLMDPSSPLPPLSPLMDIPEEFLLPAVPKPKAPVPKPKLPVPEPKLPVSKPKSPVPKPKSPVSKPKSPVSKPKSPVSKPKTLVPKTKTPVVPPEKKTVRSVVVNDIPKRSRKHIPCVSAQDARNRINRHKRSASPEKREVKRSRTKESDTHSKKREPTSQECAPVSPLSRECLPSAKEHISQERKSSAKEHISRESSSKEHVSQECKSSAKEHVSREYIPSARDCVSREPRSFRPYRPRQDTDRRVHLHNKCMAALCITREGYTVSNGVKSYSYDFKVDPQQLYEDITALKVGHLFTTDSETHQQWKTFQEKLDTFHPMKELRAIHLDIKKEIQPCLYCSRYCHRWKAVMGGIVQLLHVAVDPIPHH